MIRNLKVLGLALAAVFAMSAMVASAASAQGKLTTGAGQNVTLNGTETGAAGSNQLQAFGANIRCPGSTYTGHRYNVTAHTFIQPNSTRATLTPKYLETVAGKPNCVAAGLGWTATVDMNGCDYVVNLGPTDTAVGTYDVTFDVVCTGGNEITVTLWTNETEHLNDTNFDNPFCVLHVPGVVDADPTKTKNQNLKGAHVTNTGSHVALTGLVEGITVTKTASATHPVLCAAASTTTAKFALDVTVTAKNETGAAESISISH